MRLQMFSVLAGLLAAAGAVSASPIITVGNHPLLPDTPGQKITINISGGDALAGANLFAQIGDGGPELANYGLPAGTDGPAITGVDFQPIGGIFTGSGTQTNLPGIPQVVNTTFDVTSGTVSADGKFVVLTIDTTGFTEGTWDLRLGNVLPFAGLGGPYDTSGVGSFASTIDIAITNGSLTVVPEPATLAILAAGGCLMCIRRRRGR